MAEFQAWTWGKNDRGQTGDGTFFNRSSPVTIERPDSCAEISLGFNHSLFIDVYGMVWSCGAGDNGRLGNGSNYDVFSAMEISRSGSYTKISAGYGHSLAIDGSTGEVYAWGWNSQGQLGTNDEDNYSSPVSIAKGLSFKDISAGNQFSLFLDPSGMVYASGINYGNLGTNDLNQYSSPVSIARSSSYTKIAAGVPYGGCTSLHHSLITDGSDGMVWAFGENFYGFLGDGTTAPKSSPVAIARSGSYSAIAAGAWHSLAIDGSTGMVYSWGYNGDGQLGDGTMSNKSSPESIIRSGSYIAIAADAYNSYAIDSNGMVWAWGENNRGQLGDNTTDSKSSPVAIARIDEYSRLDAGLEYAGVIEGAALPPSVSYAVSTVKTNFISVRDRSIKRSNKFSCLGWISDPRFDKDEDPLVGLAVSDRNDDVEDSEGALKFEIIKEIRDYRLQFSNSKSKLIRKSTGISIDDAGWHFLGYVCTGDGKMRYYVDGLYLPPEEGTGPSGVLFSTAWSRQHRQGGGSVWSPYLYKSGQAISVYHWRFVSDVVLHQQWILDLMKIDQRRLFFEEQ